MKIGDYVRTVRSETESKDWNEDARVCVRWGVVGKIVAMSDSHGECFCVEHDGMRAWYEPRELVLADRSEGGWALP